MFLGEFFKAVQSAKESPSTKTQPITDLTQTEYNEFRIKRIPDITFLGEFSMLQKCPPFGHFWRKPSLKQTGNNEYPI